ncbi:hypothetical protein B0T18DRAFT_394590 [Schizothecium vesticola]|uniref:Single-strand DNA deaminase toxin A-like C-terminal domain-containing protein n=1 Tax=Schizothecium vesticola TaxID=314040 RepID=A0AA40BQ06_9PEZI|nr:hypothetical protein B0T18DRAFT_394590 [Schizothecium vesticola]
MANIMAEPRAQNGNCHDAPASTPSGLKVNDYAVLYEGQFRVLFSVEFIKDFGRPLNNSTTGWIESDAEPGIRKNAISGWKRGSGNVDILNSELYTAHVFKVSEDISFYIEPHKFDNNFKRALPHQVGRFNASHIEKFLALWWVEKVLFFCFKTKDLSRMHELSGVELPARMARATVVLNNEPCKNCLDFLDEVYRITTIRIKTRQIPFLQPRDRTRIKEYTHYDEDEGEGEGEEVDQDVHQGSPETPRPAVPRKARGPKATKALTHSSAPEDWTTFDCEQPCAKPPTTKVTCEEYGGLLPFNHPTTISRPREDESGSVCVNPKSSNPSSRSNDEAVRTVKSQSSENDSRSCNSPSPSPSTAHLRRSLPSSQLQVRLGYIDPKTRAEYRRIEDHPESPRQSELSPPAPAPEEHNTPPPRSPNLKRFMYGGGVVTPTKRYTNEKTRKPKGPTKAERARRKSTFLKARERAEKQGGKVQNGLELKAQTPVPVTGTEGGADDDDDDAYMVPVHPSFLAECGLDVVMG